MQGGLLVWIFDKKSGWGVWGLNFDKGYWKKLNHSIHLMLHSPGFALLSFSSVKPSLTFTQRM